MATSKKASKESLKTFADDNEFSAQEENIHRMKNGVGVKDDEVLERKTKNPELLARLLELERAIIKRASSQKP